MQDDERRNGGKLENARDAEVMDRESDEMRRDPREAAPPPPRPEDESARKGGTQETGRVGLG